jgi:hypothetical protein
MITYFYWLLVVGLAITFAYLAGAKIKSWRLATIGTLAVLLVGWAAYFFHFEQLFVKRWGGVMTISIPDGQQHLGATWKDDNLWIENYDPASNTCIFSEYSKGNLLQGRVTIEDCNPFGLRKAGGGLNQKD